MNVLVLDIALGRTLTITNLSFDILFRVVRVKILLEIILGDYWN
jgi:hypothetical protein